MNKIFKLLLTITEVGMIAYWIFATAVLLEIIQIDPALMYSDYKNPIIVSWNWSFLPIDLLFAILGLVATYVPMNGQRQQFLSTISLSLMFCAGLMAIAFWAIQGSFDPTWWAVNLWLMLLATAVLIYNYTKLNVPQPN